MLRDLELLAADHERLIAACDAADITFLTTPIIRLSPVSVSTSN
jgi:hypothetical protein